jgi:hypothetical protein
VILLKSDMRVKIATGSFKLGLGSEDPLLLHENSLDADALESVL